MSRRREEGRYSRYDDRDGKGRLQSRGDDDGIDLWDAQFGESTAYPRAPPAPSFSNETSAAYSGSYGQSYSGIYDDFPSVPSAPQPPSIQWNQLMLPPAPDPAPMNLPQPAQNLEAQMKKEEAIESEVRNQKATLVKQREEYSKKAAILKKELETLRDQRNELRGDSKRSPSPDSKRFLKENAKLQLEITNKLKTINNVVDMLNGIIGEKAVEVTVKDAGSESDSQERTPHRKSRSPVNKDKKFNYVYYDPEMHWCRICNDFPPTAKEYLNHLHSPVHHKSSAAHLEAPWHGKGNNNEGLPNYPNAPVKRTPIRGLQFFVPATAWYCKLCDEWIGDLHCASAHLKSIMHSKNYTNFVEQNPHWETDWMSDRQKSFEKSRSAPKSEEKQQYTAHTITFDKDGFTKKKKDKSASPPAAQRAEKKKKKEGKKFKRKRQTSSSSSSSSDRGRKKEKKQNMKKRDIKEKDERDEKLIEQWMDCDKLTDKERKMLEELQNSIRGKGKDRQPVRERQQSEQSNQRERERELERKKLEQIKRLEREERRKDEERRDERGRDRENRDGRPGGGDKAFQGKGNGQNGGPSDKKFNEPKKMPFIGKMPVFKSLSKALKTEEAKEVEQKKVDIEATKKKQQEIDAEIRRKVAEFKRKIKTKAEVGPPGVALPTTLGGSVPNTGFTQPPPTASTQPPPISSFPQTIHRVQKEPVLVSGDVMPAAPPPAPKKPPPPQSTQQAKGPLHRDFQEALDIIFPAEKKPDPPVQSQQQKEQVDMSMYIPGLGPPGMGPPGMGPPGMGPPPYGPPMQGFPGMGMMPHQMNGSPIVMGYDFNPPPMFSGPTPQLYDRQVPLMPQQQQKGPPHPASAAHQRLVDDNADDLAMLGIDAADVGAGLR